MAYGDPPRSPRTDPPAVPGYYLAEDESAGWQVMLYDDMKRWYFRAPSGWFMQSYPIAWADLPYRTEGQWT